MPEIDSAAERQRILSAVNGAEGRVTGITEKLQTLLTNMRKEVAKVRDQKHLVPEALDEQVVKVREKYAGELEQLRQSFADTIAEVDAVHSAVFSAPATSSVAEEALAEQKLQRAWDRAVRALDAGRTPEIIARQAVKDGDRHTFRALRAELPAYMRATGQGRVVDGTMVQVAIHERDLMEADELAAISEAEKARKMAASIEFNLGTVQLEITGRSRADFLANGQHAPTIDTSKLGRAA